MPTCNKIIALVGMCGAGKSVVADQLAAQGCQFIRFGQITLDEIKKQGLEPSEANQRKIRETFRQQHGMAAFAVLNIPKIDELLKSGPVVIDGLYSWSEYKILKEKYNSLLTVLAIYASPQTRYSRISQRKPDNQDTDLRQHHFSITEAQARDYAELENIEKGGPIAMADYTLINEGTAEELTQQLAQLDLF
ncbi:MAG: AAA family ATPase [bacterium]